MLLLVCGGCTGRAAHAPAPVGNGGARGDRVEGGLIYFWSDRDWPALWSMRADGSRERRISTTPQNAKRPVPSPDGRWIAFDGEPPGGRPLDDFDVQIVRQDGSGRRTLAGTSDWELDAVWSPDGSRLSYSRYRAGGPDAWRRSWIWTVGSDGHGARRLARGQFARWSPDASTLVLDAPTRGSDGDLFLVDARGGRVLRRLTATPALEQAAAWSPDGRRVAFTSARSGFDQVFVMNADGSDQRQLSRGGYRNEATSWR